MLLPATPPNTLLELARLQEALQAYRYRVATERCLHEGVVLALQSAAIAFEHEYAASPNCRFDFFIPESGIALELKIAGAYSEALRQAKRYLELPLCKAVLVASSKRWATLNPSASEDIILCAKPVRMLRLSTQAFS